MRYHNITNNDMLNGEGLRIVLWVSGCPHACKGCHNQITWNKNSGLPFEEDERRELFQKLNQEHIDGVTFSGGEPLALYNIDEITRLAKTFKLVHPNKTIWVYTGYSFEDVSDLAVMDYIDVLVDGKFIKDLADNQLKWKGSSNQRVIDVQKTIKNGYLTYYSANY